MSVVFDPRTGAALATAGGDAQWFRDFLLTQGIRLKASCPFGQALSALEKLSEWTRGGVQPLLSIEKRYAIAADAFGADLITKSVRRTISKTAEPLRPYWPLFAKCDPNQIRRGRSDTGRNLVWELLVGVLVANFATDLARVEPDLRCTYLDRRWGLSCKAFYSFDVDQQIDSIVEGVKQLEGADTDRGIVIVNLANIFSHAELFAQDFPTSQAAILFVTRGHRQFLDRFRTRSVERRLTSGADGMRDKTRMVLFFCPTVVNVQQHPTLFCSVEPFEFRRVRDEEHRFAHSFRKAAVLAL
jgi:hypothetical protein